MYKYSTHDSIIQDGLCLRQSEKTPAAFFPAFHRSPQAAPTQCTGDEPRGANRLHNSQIILSVSDYFAQFVFPHGKRLVGMIKKIVPFSSG